MCNGTDHNELNDSLGDIFGDMGIERPAAPLSAEAIRAVEVASASFTEACKACGGSGRFVSYAGRDCGACFKCKGKGKLSFRTSPAQRAAGRESAQRSADRKAAQLAEAADAWKADNAADAAWIDSRKSGFTFAAAMAEALSKYGFLTERQAATVTRLRLADAERDANRAVAAAERFQAAPAVNVSAIAEAFARAREAGIKRPKMKLAAIGFSRAPDTGANAGAIYVKGTDSHLYLGKVADGRFIASRDCSAEKKAEVLSVLSDPKAAAIAYGKQYGVCCVCSRELSDPVSVANGIGPICAERFGW